MLISARLGTKSVSKYEHPQNHKQANMLGKSGDCTLRELYHNDLHLDGKYVF